MYKNETPGGKEKMNVKLEGISIDFRNLAPNPVLYKFSQLEREKLQQLTKGVGKVCLHLTFPVTDIESLKPFQMKSASIANLALKMEKAFAPLKEVMSSPEVSQIMGNIRESAKHFESLNARLNETFKGMDWSLPVYPQYYGPGNKTYNQFTGKTGKVE